MGVVGKKSEYHLVCADCGCDAVEHLVRRGYVSRALAAELQQGESFFKSVVHGTRDGVVDVSSRRRLLSGGQ